MTVGGKFYRSKGILMKTVCSWVTLAEYELLVIRAKRLGFQKTAKSGVGRMLTAQAKAQAAEERKFQQHEQLARTV